MAQNDGMKNRTIRETDEVWDAVTATAKDNGEDASTVTRQFWRKYAKKRIAEGRKVTAAPVDNRRPKDIYTEQMMDEDADSMGEGARRDYYE
jgi:hypothetical protein